MLRLLLQRRQDQGHPAAFHARGLVNTSHIFKLFDKACKQLVAMFLIQDVPATKLNPGLDHVALAQEFSRVLRLELKVMRIGTWPKTNFFKRNGVRFLALFFFLFLLFVPVFAVVDNLADRWFRIRGDLNEIQVIAFG